MLFFVLLLVGCDNRLTNNRIELSNKQYEIIDYDASYLSSPIANANSLNVAVLLPLTGSASNIGQGMQNAMFMALDDLKSDSIVLNFYDTNKTSGGASDAVRDAISGGANIILGPLVSSDVAKVSLITKAASIPVVSYTTSPQVLQQGVYSIGLLTGEQIDRIINYAKSKGRSRVALLVPDSASGLNILKSTLMSTVSANMSLVKVGFYDEKSIDYSTLIKDISHPLDENGNKLPLVPSKDDAKIMVPQPADFDVVLIADSGNRLKSIASMFAYNDVMYPNVLFAGTSAWDNTNLSKETILHRGVYPMVTKNYGKYFTEKYTATFEQHPQSIYSFAYDSVLLASVISNNVNDVDNALTADSGFIGVNGFFKILPTGQSRHSLEVLEVTKDGTKVVSKENVQSSDYTENEFDIRYIPYDKLPHIYGKNNTEVLSWLYNN